MKSRLSLLALLLALFSTDANAQAAFKLCIDNPSIATCTTVTAATPLPVSGTFTPSGGAPNVTTSQVTVTTSSTAVCPVRALRRSCSVTTITGTQQVFCSGTTATTANGQFFPAAVGASFPFQTTAAVNCIAVSSSQVVSVTETF